MAKKQLNNVEVQVFESELASLVVRESLTYEIKMETRAKSKLRGITMVCFALAVSGIIYLGYFCPDQVCALSSGSRSPADLNAWADSVADSLGQPLSKGQSLSYDEVLNENFDMNGHDVMVFLHIQKTGGTSFGKHLVRDLDLKRPCTCHRKRKRCYCFRPNSTENWLFSRYSTGWKCGLHADWTELTNCVDSELDKNEGGTVKRRYFYITLLRDPVSRFLSEYRHVQRGATWRNARHWCGGHEATEEELPRCYPGETWQGVDLSQFLACPFNLGANRQTRMLADLALVGCYNRTYLPEEQRNTVLLTSAKRNLASMAFFGLTEYQKVSQYVFEETFNLRFSIPFEQHNATVSGATMNELSEQQLALIKKANALDIELYDFAKELMYRRFHRLRAKDAHFRERFSHLGEIPGQDFNWDRLQK
ncbi:heparan-sulfate 6-O-sulfotransferase 2 [Neocloeon triangulifer]|uniref:heparan-sulfate 6-O-sulfotransferase 2 n=1 Tax=Neocloeon triangulifer TaxID=2078957 RepID=UPI00286F3725|nr:heparan-sulfate 6-O-sulfotransferase 2 [Neocloeon triangulifer]